MFSTSSSLHFLTLKGDLTSLTVIKAKLCLLDTQLYRRKQLCLECVYSKDTDTFSAVE